MLPSQTDMFLSVFEFFVAAVTATRKDAREAIANRFQLTAEEHEGRIPSGVRTYESQAS